MKESHMGVVWHTCIDTAGLSHGYYLHHYTVRGLWLCLLGEVARLLSAIIVCPMIAANVGMLLICQWFKGDFRWKSQMWCVMAAWVEIAFFCRAIRNTSKADGTNRVSFGSTLFKPWTGAWMCTALYTNKKLAGKHGQAWKSLATILWWVITAIGFQCRDIKNLKHLTSKDSWVKFLNKLWGARLHIKCYSRVHSNSI